MLNLTIILFSAYVVYITARYGWLPSISHSFLVKKEGWVFVAWCLTIGVMLFISLVETSEIVAFVAFGFIVVGANPQIDSPFQKKIHYWGALYIILGGCAMVLVDVNPWLGAGITVAIGLFALLSHLFRLPNKIFWIEIVAFLLIIIPFVL